MPRLIDADALERDIRKDAYCLYEADDAIAFVRDAPTIDAEPVRHGHWIYHPMSRMTECSFCHRWFHDVFYADNAYRFCRSCGAKMDEEASNDN